MSEPVFVIRNQLQQFWTRAGDWVDGREPQRLLKFRHRDEALNQLVELSARDITLRGEVLRADIGERGEPIVDASEHKTPTLAEIAAAKAAEKAADEAAGEGEADSDEVGSGDSSAEADAVEAGEPPLQAAV
ncbi:MAG: hypothetical protein AAFY29_13105 [Pseudomonadota bacterium]